MISPKGVARKSKSNRAGVSGKNKKASAISHESTTAGQGYYDVYEDGQWQRKTGSRPVHDNRIRADVDCPLAIDFPEADGVHVRHRRTKHIHSDDILEGGRR